jgi:DNA-binding NtrC family response regulator
MRPADGKIPTVLVVDDEALIRWSLAESLSDAGYRVAEAASAGEALRRVDADGGIALVLLDLRMPDCSDLGFFQALRQRVPSTPIIVMTAYGSAELEQEARAAGAFDVVKKPFDMSAMVGLAARPLPM